LSNRVRTEQATLKVKVTSFSFTTNRKSDFHGLLRCTFI
jgi:hypothetical protein